MSNKTELCDKLYVYADETSLHGIGKVSKQESHFLRRAAWFLLTLAAFCGLFYTLVTLVMKHQTYPSNTKVEKVSQEYQRLPAITICNNNKMKRSFLDVEPIAKLFYREISRVRGIYTVDFEKIEKNQPELWKWLRETDAVTFAHRQASHLIANSSVAKLIHNCTMVGSNIPCDNLISQIQTSTEDVCFTISNKKLPANESLNIARTGSFFGLYIQLNIHHDEYTEQAYSWGTGLKAVIHEDTTFPPLNSYDFAVSPGMEIYVGLSKTKVKRLPKPFNQEECRNTFPEYLNQSSQFTTYSREGCTMLCFAHFVREAVGCDIIGDQDYIRNCTMYEYHKFIASILTEVHVHDNRGDNKSCGCLRPCTETKYNVQLSSMSFPSNIGSKILQSRLGFTESYIRENLLTVTVYFQELDETLIEQQAAYDAQALLADIGGQMGLYLGASIITVVEIFELIIIYIMALLSSKLAVPHPPAKSDSVTTQPGTIGSLQV